jgi:hypothetical protein
MNYDTINEDDLKLFIPSGIVISGPSSSGKTQLVLKILEHADVLFHPPPKAISKYPKECTQSSYFSMGLWGIFQFDSRT